MFANVRPASAFISIAGFLFAAASPMAATTFTVTNTNDSGTGSLREAINSANASPGSLINFSEVSGTIMLASSLPAISQDMTITGPGANLLTISGNNEFQILRISSGTTTLSGLTFANALVNSGNDGAILNFSTLTVINCMFIHNSAPHNLGGGAIFNNASLTVNGSTFANNTAQLFGGAIVSTTYGTLVVNNSTFFANSANQGGAIYSEGPLILSNSTISGNSAYAGGGIFNGGASSVSNSILTGNTGVDCQGAGCNANAPYILVSGSEQQINGAWDRGTITISWTDSHGNYYSQGVSYGEFSTPASIASAFGALISNNYSPNATAEAFGPLIEFWLGNGATFGPFVITNSSPSFTLTTVEVNILASANIVGTAANLSPLGNYGGPTQTMLPQPGSPAICAGSAALIPAGTTADQRGFNRVTTYNGTTCLDIGAVQTGYTAATFSASSYTGVVNQAVTPAPIVTVTENDQNIGGVPVTLTYSGASSPTGLGPVTAVAGAGATFSSLKSATAGSGSLTVSLPITSSGNALQPAALTASAALNIQPPTQTIQFTVASPVSYGTAPIALSATGGGSGNAVVLTLDAATTAAATLSGSTLTINGAGNIVIDANQAGGGGYLAAAQVQRSIVVNPAAITITASSPTVTYGSAVPTITPAFGTFYNGDTSAVLSRQPTCITAYTPTSAVGSSPSTSCSGASAANYTFSYINGSVTINPAPTFTINGGSSSLTITRGATTGNTVSLTISPSNGFTGTVNLTCSVTPSTTNPPACALSPASITISGTTPQSSSLIVTTAAPTVSGNRIPQLPWPASATVLAVVLLIGIPRKRPAWLPVIVILSFSIAAGIAGCGGGVSLGSGSTGTTTGSYTVIAAGNSGGITGTVGTITLTIQ